jgi:hypothetical protein
MMKYCGRKSKPTEMVRVIKEEREKEAAGQDEEERATLASWHRAPTGDGLSDSSASVDQRNYEEDRVLLVGRQQEESGKTKNELRR